MKQLTFKVTSPKDNSTVSMIKAINSIPCRIYLDLENGLIDIEDIDDAMLDSIIELVDSHYTILNVTIDNTSEKAGINQGIPAVKETVEDISAVQEPIEDSPLETIEEPAVQESNQPVCESQPIFLEPQSENDLIIKKVEFKNKYIEDLINKLLRTAYWAMFTMKISEKEIGDFIYTCMNEISMRYNKKGCIAFSVGDVVDCNYGYHLNGETNGTHVSAIVCNISDEGMVYVVPITKMQDNISSYSYIIFDSPDDVIYENISYKGGTALLDKGKYVRPERFHAVIGKATDYFFEGLLSQLAYTFDFINMPGEIDEESPSETQESDIETTSTAETPEIVSPSVDTTDVSAKMPVSAKEDDAPALESANRTNQKVGSNESSLLEIIGSALDKLDPSKKVENQVEDFLASIGMTTTEKLIKQSFIIACDVKKINYGTVIFRLHEANPKIREELIQNILKESFKNWLKQYPTLAEKCPRISFMSILKVFAKKFS